MRINVHHVIEPYGLKSRVNSYLYAQDRNLLDVKLPPGGNIVLSSLGIEMDEDITPKKLEECIQLLRRQAERAKKDWSCVVAQAKGFQATFEWEGRMNDPRGSEGDYPHGPFDDYPISTCWNLVQHAKLMFDRLHTYRHRHLPSFETDASLPVSLRDIVYVSVIV